MNVLSLLDFASAYISISEAPIISVDCSRRNDEDEDNFAGFGGSGVGTGPNTEDEDEADESDYDDPTDEDVVEGGIDINSVIFEPMRGAKRTCQTREA